MAKKKAFALRLDEDMMAAVEKWAADEFRSTNGQLEWIIHQALKKSGRLKVPKKTENEDEKGTE
ncbi:Arc family DNA-binding protein [Microscilla marina]|uniref:Arc-like DNA binding domain-containing protein n=1 Tax=Microscilla marina ATCC 23134 TaxID=313606 RepID=A1ZSL5_MICM2|nr:Arc family DNA-binding protein [Microscilla marina]EAY26595.1 conserved hypothetical protein [Microscilla marina ATCC 23134]